MPDIILDPKELAQLATSRNHFRAVPSGQRIIEGPQYPEDTYRLPAIDIGEPGMEPDAEVLILTGGQAKMVPFWYDVGVPPADRYWIEWYRTEADRDARTNMYTDYKIETIFYPLKPIPNTNDRAQRGSVYMNAPVEVGNIVLLGKMIIHQPDEG